MTEIEINSSLGARVFFGIAAVATLSQLFQVVTNLDRTGWPWVLLQGLITSYLVFTFISVARSKVVVRADSIEVRQWPITRRIQRTAEVE